MWRNHLLCGHRSHHSQDDPVHRGVSATVFVCCRCSPQFLFAKRSNSFLHRAPWSKQRMMEVVVTTGVISRANLQSNRHHAPTNQHPVFYRPDALPVAQPTVSSTEWKISHSMDLLTPSSPGGLPTLSLATNSSWLPWGRFAMPLISPLMPVSWVTCS